MQEMPSYIRSTSAPQIIRGFCFVASISNSGSCSINDQVAMTESSFISLFQVSLYVRLAVLTDCLFSRLIRPLCVFAAIINWHNQYEVAADVDLCSGYLCYSESLPTILTHGIFYF